MAKKPPSANADKFVVRMPDGLRERISELAEANGRSMNSEIVFLLKMAMADPGIDWAKQSETLENYIISQSEDLADQRAQFTDYIERVNASNRKLEDQANQLVDLAQQSNAQKDELRERVAALEAKMKEND